jgi:putative ABC transport system permease protein
MEIRPIISTMLRNKTAPLLIAAQVALTLAIICNALYIIRDRLATAARPSGVDEQNVAHIRFYPHRKIADLRGMQDRDIEAIRGIPGVVSVAQVNQIAMSQSGWNIGGLTTEKDIGTDISTGYYFSQHSLVDTLGLTLVAGRDFVETDFIENDPEKEQKTPPNIILTEALAKRLFDSAEAAIGKDIYLGSGPENEPVRVVGVVDHLQTPGAPADNQRAEQSSIAPIRWLDGYTMYAVRAEPGRLDAVMTEVEKKLLALSSDRVLLDRRTMTEVRENRYAGEKMMAGLLIGVTVFLLLITASGIVGMASLWVNQRRKQIGVRRALGAQKGDILRYFLVENVLITTGGIVVGLALAIGLNNLLVAELEIPRLPVSYLLGAMAGMWVLGLASVFGPAWRAAAVPPAIATRTA